MPEWPLWETRFQHFLVAQGDGDAAHDLAHVQRVVANARRLAADEAADLAVVVPAAWLHDCVTVPKDSAQRPFASRLAAATAGRFLRAAGYPAVHVPAIEHAIAAHSFSAQIRPDTREAKVVQDADRLDAIGAIGIARCLMLGGSLGTPLYAPHEPFPERRTPDDRVSVIDHFYTKLLTLRDTMQTAAGRAEAERRTAFMEDFLQQLHAEIS